MSLKRIAENDVDGVNKLLQLLSEINDRLYENNRILEMDHEAIVRIADDVRKIKVNMQ